MKTITPTELSRRLAPIAESVCRWLLPNGKLVNGEWCVGSPGGEEGRSCKVRVAGERAGVWADFAGDAKGDLLDLIREVKQCSMREAIREAKAFIGVREPEQVVRAKKYRTPTKTPPCPVSGPALSPVVKYLVDERKLSRSIIEKYKVGELQGKTDWAVVYASYSPEGEQIAAKYIALTRSPEGKKKIWNEKDCPPSLWGWQAVSPDARQVVITEGQIDAMTWAMAGYQAMSIPNGTGDCEGWIEYDWENLEQFDTIFLNFDMDKPGREAVERVVQRLGRHRCLDIQLEGHKDANEALQAGKDKSYFDSAHAAAKPFTPKEVCSPMDFRDKVMEKIFGVDGKREGFWPPLLNRKLGFRHGELTIWTGVSGHGKSTYLLQMVCEILQAREKAAIASMEMQGHATVSILCRQLIRTYDSTMEITEKAVDGALDMLTGRCWIFNVEGEICRHKLFDLMEYSAKRHGVTHFVIDSLMKLDVASDDYEAQRKALNDLVNFARSNRIHIHLVCHPNKQGNEDSPIGKMNIKGASEIFNQADNIVVVHRNKTKEKKMMDNEPEASWINMPDASAVVLKDRAEGEEFRVNYSFDKIGKLFKRITIDMTAR